MVTNKLASRSRQNTSDLFLSQAETVEKDSELAVLPRSAYQQIMEDVPAFQKPERPCVLEPGAKWVRPNSMDPTKLSFIAGGLDWLGLLAFGGPVSDDIHAACMAKRKAAAETHKPQYIELGGHTWKVEGKGTGVGSNSYDILLSCGFLYLNLNKRQGKGPVAHIWATGQYCNTREPQALHLELKRIVAAVGVKADYFKVERMDIFGDISGLMVSRVGMAFFQDKVVTRASDICLRFKRSARKMTSFSFGSRTNVFCRIYDKVEELSKDDDKKQQYLNAMGLEELPETMLRVEYAVRSDFLRETWRAETSDEVFASLSSLAEYLTQEWFRVCSQVDRNHTEQSKPAAWWAYLRGQLTAVFKTPEPRPQRPAPMPKTEKAAELVLGGIAAILAKNGLWFSTPQEAMASITFTENQLQKFRDRIEQKFTQNQQRLAAWVHYCAESASEAAQVLGLSAREPLGAGST